MITQAELIALLREQAPPGKQEQWSNDHDIQPSYVSDVLRGRRDPGKSILAALGYERVVLYQKVDKQ